MLFTSSNGIEGLKMQIKNFYNELRIRVYLGIFTFALLSAISGCNSRPEIKQSLEVKSREPVLEAKFNPDITEYALLINGTFGDEHTTNLLDAYSSLLKRGYNPNNVFIVAPSDPRPITEKGDLRDFGRYFETRFGALEKAVNELKSRVDKNDMLLIYMTGDGIKKEDNFGERSCLELTDGNEINSESFAKSVLRLNCGGILAVFGQCYSGDFARKLYEEAKKRGKLVTTVSSTDEDFSTFGRTYNRAFWDAVNGGKSIERAHKYATGKVITELKPKHPEEGNTKYFSTDNREHNFTE